MRTARRRAPRALAIAGLGAFACNDPGESPPGPVEASVGLSTIPREGPTYRGTIVQATVRGGATLADASGTIVVERRRGVADSRVAIHWNGRATRMAYRRDGQAAPPDELARGVAVSVWTNGVEMRSMPPQANALVIVVE